MVEIAQKAVTLLLHVHGTVLKTREMLPVALRATYPENQVALTKIK